MKIYIDYVLLINFLFDFILLLGISIILKRSIKPIRLFLGSIFGAFTIFILFINISSLVFFLLKMFLGLIMIIITFKYKDLKYTINNYIYLMILSIILGGLLYFINIQIGYEHTGMLFYTNGNNINILILFFISTIALYFYIMQQKKYKKEINLFYKVELYMKNKKILLNGFIDTGNDLYDPYFNKPILILNKNIKIKTNKFIFVPFNTLNSKGIMKCYYIDKIYIHDIGYKNNVLVGISNDKFKLSGVDIILNKEILE